MSKIADIQKDMYGIILRVAELSPLEQYRILKQIKQMIEKDMEMAFEGLLLNALEGKDNSLTTEAENEECNANSTMLLEVMKSVSNKNDIQLSGIEEELIKHISCHYKDIDCRSFSLLFSYLYFSQICKRS